MLPHQWLQLPRCRWAFCLPSDSPFPFLASPGTSFWTESLSQWPQADIPTRNVTPPSPALRLIYHCPTIVGHVPTSSPLLPPTTASLSLSQTPAHHDPPVTRHTKQALWESLGTRAKSEGTNSFSKEVFTKSFRNFHSPTLFCLPKRWQASVSVQLVFAFYFCKFCTLGLASVHLWLAAAVIPWFLS